MPQRQGRIRIHGHGEVEVALVEEYLADLKHAYESLLVFESVMDGFKRVSREFPFPVYPGLMYGWPLGPRRAVRYVRDWPPTADEVSSLVPHSEQLILSAVRLSSPGFWEFLGKINPLEVIRQYLNDRHERRKDREYRESAEERRLRLENIKLENEAIAGRVRIAKELGATDKDLAPLLNELVNKPLLALDRHQDKDIIEHAEIDNDQDRNER
ncbi:hypothetical protein [Acidihalobacter aeolianus]|uniref:hypothetical protein n=1 Tax=Acidihalobacter aeolianus TaxID=2792603 RepID=UPI0012EA5ECF|nr:hypothetical protein [Acidihalobacter aeolianus]